MRRWPQIVAHALLRAASPLLATLCPPKQLGFVPSKNNSSRPAKSPIFFSMHKVHKIGKLRRSHSQLLRWGSSRLSPLQTNGLPPNWLRSLKSTIHPARRSRLFFRCTKCTNWKTVAQPLLAAAPKLFAARASATRLSPLQTNGLPQNWLRSVKKQFIQPGEVAYFFDAQSAQIGKLWRSQLLAAAPKLFAARASAARLSPLQTNGLPPNWVRCAPG